MRPLYHLRLSRSSAGTTIDTLLVFLAADEMPSSDLISLVDTEAARNLSPDEMVVVVRETSRAAVAAAIGAGRRLERVRRRLGPAATTTVVGFDAEGAEAGREVASGPAGPSTMTLAEVGRRGTTAVFRDHGGFVEANASYHFRNPSGRHTDRFLRLSNLLVSHAELSLIAMTLLPLVPVDAVEAHVDTPAMFALVSAVNEHLRSLSPARRPLACDSFRSYLGVAEHDFAGVAKGVVLISATSSGGLAKIVEARRVEPARIAHVLYLGPSTPRYRAAVDLAFDAKINPEGIGDQRETYQDGSCALCDAGSTAVDLQGDQFDLGGPDFEPLTLKKTDAPDRLDQVMERLAGHGVFRVAATPTASGWQYDVGADALLSSPRFATRLDYFAKVYVPAGARECIVLDADARTLAERLAVSPGSPPAMIESDDVDSLDREARAPDGTPLDGAPILIVAAVAESGRVLLDVSRDLRKVRPSSPQIYIVGLLKSGSTARRQQLERTLVQTQGATPHRFAVIEELLLPPAGSPNAWHAERDFLDDAVANGATLSNILDARQTALRHSSTPLVDDLFMANGPMALRLQPGFVFWPPGLPQQEHPRPAQADVFYTISAVLQKLRTTPPKPGARALKANWFQQTLLDPENLGRFNDAVIQASLLRAARPAEIDFSGEVGGRLDAGRVVGRIVSGADRPRGEAAAEILIALGSKRLRLTRACLEEVLRPSEAHPPLIAELVQLCQRRLL